MKRAVLSQEVIRRFLNTSEEESTEIKDSILLKMAMRLNRSGYKQRQVEEIISSGVKGYQGKWGNGVTRNRRGIDTEASRRIRKLVEKITWYKCEINDTDMNETSKPGQIGPKYQLPGTVYNNKCCHICPKNP